MKFSAIIILNLSLIAIANAQNAASNPNGTIAVGTKILVSKDHPDRPQWETMMAIDPENPRNMLACWNDGTQDSKPTSHTVVYSSFDGGKNWRKTLDIPPPGTYSCDPTCAYGPGGVAYASALTSQAPIYRSTDAGKTWTKAVELGASFDRPWITVDNTESKNRGLVYFHSKSYAGRIGSAGLVQGIDLWRSSNQAVGFFGPAKIVSDTNYGHFPPSKGAILTDGTFFIVANQISLDAGVITQDGNHRIVAMQLNETGRRFASSTAVNKWYQPANITSLSCSTGPVLAADTSSGPFKDRLYTAWADNRRGKLDILISRSSDRGKSWSEPNSIKNDVLKKAGSNSCTSAIAVNNAGVVGIIWREQFDHPERDNGEKVRHETFFAASLDGGETFLQPTKLSEKVLPKNYRIGETIGLDVDRNGNFHALWVENRTGNPQIYYAPITVKSGSKGS